MSQRLGLSSGCHPELSASELAGTIRRAGGDVVDLRAGKRHAWEREGLSPFAAAGIHVAFVGVSVVLGEEMSDSELERMVAPFAGLPLKVFAREGCSSAPMRATTQRQLQVLAAAAGGVSHVLVETHHGYAPAVELASLHESHGVRLVLDTMGLARLEPQPLEALRFLAPMVVGAQVKGFEMGAVGESRHVPLSETDPQPTLAMLEVVSPHARFITVETRAGSGVRDLQWLQNNLVDRGV